MHQRWFDFLFPGGRSPCGCLTRRHSFFSKEQHRGNQRSVLVLPPSADPPPLPSGTPLIGAGKPRSRVVRTGGDQYRGRLSGAGEGRDHRLHGQSGGISRHWFPRRCAADERCPHARQTRCVSCCVCKYMLFWRAMASLPCEVCSGDFQTCLISKVVICAYKYLVEGTFVCSAFGVVSSILLVFKDRAQRLHGTHVGASYVLFTLSCVRRKTLTSPPLPPSSSSQASSWSAPPRRYP